MGKSQKTSLYADKNDQVEREMTKDSIHRKREVTGLVANAYLKKNSLELKEGGLGVPGYSHRCRKFKVSLSC